MHHRQAHFEIDELQLQQAYQYLSEGICICHWEVQKPRGKLDITLRERKFDGSDAVLVFDFLKSVV